MTPMLKTTLVLHLTVFLSFIARSSCLVRLASWNLLAQEYAKPSKYPWCEPQHLDWEYRQSLILPQILGAQADLVCLQEVQVDLWPGLLKKLEPLYDGILQNVTSGHQVASALLIKKASSIQLERIESRSRVLLAVLNDKSKKEKDSKLYLSSVHLEAGSTRDSNLQRYFQLKSLFKRLAHHCCLDDTELEDASVILAGDFNMLRTNPLHSDLSRGLLYHPEQMHNKPPIKTIKLYDAYMDVNPEMSSNSRIKASKICYPSGEGEDRKQLVRTYARGYVLDYILTSQQVDIHETLLLHAGASMKETQKWPSQEHPSDHLPIAVDLEW